LVKRHVETTHLKFKCATCFFCTFFRFIDRRPQSRPFVCDICSKAFPQVCSLILIFFACSPHT
jgi:hypothetical protein